MRTPGQGREVRAEEKQIAKCWAHMAETSSTKTANDCWVSQNTATPKSGVSYTFQSANRSKGQARLDYILTKQAGRRLIRCVNVRRPPLEGPESDHNLVRESPHPTQVRTNPEEKGRYQRNSESGRPLAVDG